MEYLYGLFDVMLNEYVCVFKSVNDETAKRSVATMKFGVELLDMQLYRLASFDVHNGSVVNEAGEFISSVSDIIESVRAKYSVQGGEVNG